MMFSTTVNTNAGTNGESHHALKNCVKMMNSSISLYNTQSHYLSLIGYDSANMNFARLFAVWLTTLLLSRRQLLPLSAQKGSCLCVL